MPNPGKIGIGVLLLAPDGRREEKSVLLNISGCNNEAELHALCAALELAATAGARQLVLRGDSDVALIWIPRHRNGDADRLSRQALGLPPGPADIAGSRRRR